MNVNQNKKNNLLFSIILFLCVYLFFIYLNAIFPVQSDDIGRKIGGCAAMKQSYNGWNGRLGELLLVAFGSFFATTPFYSFVNGFIGASVIMLLFAVFTGRLPERTLKDFSIFCVILLFIMFDPSFAFGSVFYWAAGSFNYLWGWFLILLWLLPFTLFWRNVSFSKSANIVVLIIEILTGIFAGWSSELGIVFIVLNAISIVAAFKMKRKLPAWYFAGFISFCIGWGILYSCPGMRLRANLFSNYLSIGEILKLGLVGIMRRIKTTFDSTNSYFYYQNFLLLSLFLLLTSLFYKPSLEKFESCVLAVFLLFYSIRSLPKICYVLCAIFISVMSCFVIKKENKYLSNLFYIVAGVLIAEFLFIGAGIQLCGYLPGRAYFQCTICNLALIAVIMEFCFEIFKDKIKIQKIACISCCAVCVLFSTFVAIECYKMSEKWTEMELEIRAQKNNGKTAIVIDKNTFISRYKNYGDWGNPGENPAEWPNTSYASFYGVNSIIAK